MKESVLHPSFLEQISEETASTVRSLIARPGPLEVEIGCGKGKFLVGRAEREPSVNFLGIDRVGKWMKIGEARSFKRRLENLKFVKGDARVFLREFIEPSSVSVFHIYFPDPWPKRRHRKRRLVTSGFLTLLQDRLRARGLVELATDDPDYFAALKQAAAGTGRPWRAVREFSRRPAWEAFKTNYELKYETAGRLLFYLELEK